MATNDFKSFAVGAGANVMSQADWIALTALATGFHAGKASSAQVNKALRQSGVIASMIAQFTSDSTGQDVLIMVICPHYRPLLVILLVVGSLRC